MATKVAPIDKVSAASTAPLEEVRPMKQTSTAAALRQSLIWMREMPGIVRGLIALGWPLKWRMAAIVGFNMSLAAWEVLQAFVLAGVVAALTARDPNSFLKTAITIAYPFIVFRAPHGLVLPAIRDYFAMRCFWPQMNRELIMRSLPARDEKGCEPQPEIRGNTAPVAQEGRAAAQLILDTLLRDPAYALSGVVVLVVLYYANPWLSLLLVCGMVIDLWVTLKMDVKCNPLFIEQNGRELGVRGVEYKLHEPRTTDGKLNARERWDDRMQRFRITNESMAVVNITREAERLRTIYQLVRNALFMVFELVIYLFLAYAVHTGKIDLAAYLLFTQFAVKGCEPVKVFLGIQNRVMANRETLRRFGVLTGVDFGIKAPK